MLKFREWLLENLGDTVTSDPVNGAGYNEKGVESKWKGKEAPPLPALPFVDPDDMYLTGKRKARRKKQATLSKYQQP